MTKPNSTEIVFVVDRSGSMSNIAADMKGGFDTFVQEQRKLPGECLVTLARFDNEYELVFGGRPIADVPPLELVPRGGTALLDAIGRTMVSTGERFAKMKEEDRPSKVLFVIITDGHENASKEYKRPRIAEMIATQRKDYSWEFIFMGADENAIKDAASIGIQAQNAVFYNAAAGASARGVMRGLSAQASSLRSGKGLGNAQDAYVWGTKQEEDEDKLKAQSGSKPRT